MTGFNARNFWLFVAGVVTVVVIEAIRRWSQHDDQYDDGDDEGDDRDGGGVHARSTTQPPGWPTSEALGLVVRYPDGRTMTFDEWLDR